MIFSAPARCCPYGRCRGDYTTARSPAVAATDCIEVVVVVVEKGEGEGEGEEGKWPSMLPSSCSQVSSQPFRTDHSAREVRLDSCCEWWCGVLARSGLLSVEGGRSVTPGAGERGGVLPSITHHPLPHVINIDQHIAPRSRFLSLACTRRASMA